MQTIQKMTEPKTNIELQSNEDTFASIFLAFLGRFLRFFLVQVFHCLSIISHIVDLCILPLKVIDSAMGSTKKSSASEYILDAMGEYEGDGDDLIEAPPFRLSWPAVTVPTNLPLRRLQESTSKDSVESTEDNRSPRSSRSNKNEFAEKSKSLAKRIRTERTKLLAAVAEQPVNDQRSTSLERSPKLKRRSLRFTNELAEKSKNSIAELIKTERTKLVEKGNSIAERIHLQDRSTNIAERLQTERTKLNERTTAIAEKINIAEKIKVAKRNSFKVANRGRSFSENSKLEVLG